MSKVYIFQASTTREALMRLQQELDKETSAPRRQAQQRCDEDSVSSRGLS